VPSGAQSVLSGHRVKVWFPIRRGLMRKTVGHVKAVTDVSVSVREGQTLGVVGESGSGKTTLALALMRLIASEGAIKFGDRPVDGLSGRSLRPLRRDMQVVFQDPYGSLSPRMSVAQIVAEGLTVHGLRDKARTVREEVAQALTDVGLSPEAMDRYPHEFSGGQRQRIAIARAMILRPKVVALDEPTSALDMTVQRQIIELLLDFQRQRGLAYLFISHDLKVVRAMAHNVVVMRNGEVVEAGTADQIFDDPQHPYTRELQAAALGDRARAVAS
jgi:microcin C transport system ATP-binding protein